MTASRKDPTPDKGKNLGQGLGNITDNDRRDLAGSGDDAPTKDQRNVRTSDQRGARKHGDTGQNRTLH